jgi:hypothetical protein
VGDPTYRTIKGILAAGAETDPPPVGTGDGGADAFLHGPDMLFGNLFGNVVPLPSTDQTRGPNADERDNESDDESHDESEVSL